MRRLPYDYLMYSAWLAQRLDHLQLRTLDDLALRSGINKGTLSRYFRGLQVPSIKAVPALCEALEVSPNELLQGLGIIPIATNSDPTADSSTNS